MNRVNWIRFKNYKVFSDEQYVNLEGLSKVNVIIGKNNSGKTSLLDMVERVYDTKAKHKEGYGQSSLQFGVSYEEWITDIVFRSSSYINGWVARKFDEFTSGKSLFIEIEPNNHLELVNEESELKRLRGYLAQCVEPMRSSREGYRFRKISAERNILPEKEDELYLESDGIGASNLIRTFINDSNYNEEIIEKKLLEALNAIMIPEAEFESIRIQQVQYPGEKLWEVFLQEKGASRIALSKTGSGLKTVVLVLLNLLVVPKIKEYQNCKLVYGFEELENNLHPALQRRLFEYIYNFAIENECTIFLTTHSHIAINAFFDKEKAVIFHVIKENGRADIRKIETYIDKTEILDDLDVKASDILQSNGIIWVEGPSDRVYIKRWLEIFTPNKFEEGKDYQFLYYGGRLLSQYSAQEETELINIITTNRNAAIVIDSDKRNRPAKINDTKKRIIREFDELSMFSWVTKGKEIENYIPKHALETMLGISMRRQCGQYDLFPDYIEKYYKNFSSKKVPFANKVKEFITRGNSAGMYDLEKQIVQLYKEIEKWNQ